MNSRLNYGTIDPEARKALLGLEAYQSRSEVEITLLDLVKIRASQINGCAFCLDMHWKDARTSGETEERLYMISVWRESALYTERERAALAWTEALTLLTGNGIPDELYEATRTVFDEREIISLTMAIIAINSWNRINVAFRTEAGHYVSRRHEAKEQAQTA